MSEHDWSGYNTIVAGGIRREALFIIVRGGSSSGNSLYASMYGANGNANANVDDIRLVVCPAWHADGDFGFEIAQHLCAGVASRGGAAAMFHWPGHGESDGDPRTLTLDEFVEAGEAVVDKLISSYGPGDLAVAGVQVGAVPAVGIARSRNATKLLLIEPDLDVDAHYGAIERTARRTSLGKKLPPNWAASRFIPQLLRQAPLLEAPLLASEPNRPTHCAVVRYESSPPLDHLDAEELTVPGTRRRRSPDHHLALREAAIDWLVPNRANADV